MPTEQDIHNAILANILAVIDTAADDDDAQEQLAAYEELLDSPERMQALARELGEGREEMALLAVVDDTIRQRVDEDETEDEDETGPRTGALSILPPAPPAPAPVPPIHLPIVINMTMPEQKPPVVNVESPTVNVSVPEPKVNVEVNVPEQVAPVVNVTVAAPEQPAPVINLNVPEQPPPEVKVEVNVPEQRGVEHVIERDEKDRIKRVIDRPLEDKREA